MVSKDSELVRCPHCEGTGQIKKSNSVTPWATWRERAPLARAAKSGDRWIQIKSGRIAVVVQGCDESRFGNSLKLKHENGRTTSKFSSCLAADYTPETPPNGDIRKFVARRVQS